MSELILKLLNTKFKTRFQSTTRLIINYPEALAYIPNPTLDEFLSFFKVVGSYDRQLDASLVKRLAMRAMRKYPDIKDDSNFLNTMVFYPETINEVNTHEKFLADGLFIRTLSRKRLIDTDKSLPFLISAIEKPSFRMKFFSARFEPESIKLMGSNTKSRILNEALRNDPTVIRFINEPSFEQKRFAIGLDIKTLGLIKNQDKSDAKIALSLNPNAFQYILPENRDINMTEEALTEGNNSFEWLNIENFLSFNFSLEEIELMIKHGSNSLVSLLYLLVLNNKLDLSSDLEERIKKVLAIKEEN